MGVFILDQLLKYKHTADWVGMIKQEKKKTCPEKLDEKKLKIMAGLASLHCTFPEIAAALSVDETTLYKNEKYSSIIHKGREKGKMKLRRAMFKSALGGNVVMQIWLSKQLLGYSEKTVYDPTGNISVTLQYKLPDAEKKDYVEHEKIERIESVS